MVCLIWDNSAPEHGAQHSGDSLCISNMDTVEAISKLPFPLPSIEHSVRAI